MNLFKIPLTVTEHEVLPFLGINKTGSPQEQELINYYIKEIRKKAQPVGVWQAFAVEHHDSTKITLENSPLVLEGTITSAHFKTCKKITLLAATLGQEVDAFLAQLSEDNPAHALVFDGVASAAAEYFTEQLDNYLSGEIKRKGFFPTARFSPGYGDWPLHWQKAFLSSIEADRIGLTITSYFLLQPVKSVTAALGWSKVPVKRGYASESPTKTSPAQKPCRSSQTCPYCNFRSSCPDKLEIP